MSNQNQSEKDNKPSTSDQDAAAVKTPSETKRELTDEEIASVAGGLPGTNATHATPDTIPVGPGPGNAKAP